MHQTPARRRTRLLALVGAGSLVAPLALVVPNAWAAPELTVNEDGSYIVMLAEDSLAAYDGGVDGIPATKPSEGAKLDSTSAAAEEYTSYLERQQNSVLGSVDLDRADTTYTYTTAFNGFSAELTGNQVSALRKNPAVAAVWENEIRYADTVSTPDYLGMRGEGGVWDTQFGGDANAGTGMVVGIIDSGFWPENPSFADLPGNPAPPATWNGECVAGNEADPADNVSCNSKVIGARYYAEGNDISYDFDSPRDTNGHGSHVGGTSAGNVDVQMSVFGTDMGSGSGMAPAAHLAFYKALWETEDGGGSGTSDGLVAAIDDAVADGVDVINYSVSGSSQYVVTADELAFLDAANAGVFVSASAGNSGDTVGAGSVAHNSPWVMTVAASTHDRNTTKYVDVGGSDVVDRIYGTDRYGTAAQVALAYPEGVETVYIATGDQFADALSGGAAASQGLVPTQGLEQPAITPDGEPAPVLLTRVNSLPSATAEALEAIDPANIVIVGGEAAVSEDVEEALAPYGEVTRISGPTRYETAALIAEQYGEVDHVYVASGEDFPDALSGSALAGSEGVPVLLTRPDRVLDTVSEALSTMGDPEVHILGGSAAVSQEVFEELGATSRLSGPTRYETSVAIAEQFGYSGENPAPLVHVATGEDYPDALAASALAGYQQVPVMLSEPDGVPEAVLETIVGVEPGMAFILGGEAALNEDVEGQLEDSLNVEGDRYDGVGVGEAVGPAPLIDSEDIPAAGVDAADALLCLPDSLDPAAAADHIVICTRGTNARVEKSATVADAGGIGMILANVTDDESLNADFHSVPSIHVNGTAGDAIKAYESSDPAPVASISASGEGGEIVVPEMAGFSSYGPAIAGGGDLLKPDITAPGVDVIAAVSPAGYAGDTTDFDSYSGTSMSAPHIAGLAALMMQDNPEWGPMAVKSSMMTTADPTNSEGELITYGGAPASPLHYGSGEVEPATAYDTPLVYDSDIVDWYAYACAIGQLQLVGGGPICDQVGTTDPSDLNYPSIAIGDLGGTQTVTRTVTDATGAGGTFTAEVEAPPGLDVVVEPSTITVPSGGEATYTVTFTTEDAPLNEWTFGALTWTGAGAAVRSPLAIQPVAIGAPDEIVVEGAEGSESMEVTPGFTGNLSSLPHGLVPADSTDVEVTSDGPSGGAGIADLIVPITVPEGTTAVRVEVWEDEWTPTPLDLDLYLADGAGNVLEQSAAGGSDEAVTVTAPEPGDYLVAIDYWDGAAGATASGPLNVYMPSADEGNLTVTPSPTPVTAGVPLTLTATWSGLEAATRYLGAIGYSDGTEELDYTLVTVQTP
ncbi:cell wall-binding repeat-containing protein [Serinicoccus kebangsaanensis]|uniref:cell wall-binding repeat-containing protein n=1 Tax=Serinicoccus kebangsaanensis TaxID=2602069 RepID=UPI00124DCABD|nr:cell wall-binding repeat-containing protein [Serinicoccus kebangsaanensis]